MHSATDAEKMAAFVSRVVEIDGTRDDDDPELYLRVSAGDAVRTARTIVTGITVSDKTERELADEVRGSIWRNAGSRVYVIAVCCVGEKSPRETVTIRQEVEDTSPVSDGSAVGELTRALVKMAGAADERAMFVASRNVELADKCLDLTADLTLARARERYAEDMAELSESRVFAEAAGKFAETAAAVLVPMAAARFGMGMPAAPQGSQGDATALAPVETLLQSFESWCEANPGALACPEGIALLRRMEAAAQANMAAPAPAPAQPAAEPHAEAHEVIDPV